MTKRVLNPKTVNGHTAAPMPDRFWAKAAPPNENGCRLWLGHKGSRTGHGRFGGYPRTTVASRIAFELAYGEIGPEVLVCHTCDVGACVEPTHLYAGTALTNAQDRKQRGDGYIGAGRKLYGEAHWMTTLTQDQADEIRRLCDAKAMPQSQIAARYGVARSVVGNIYLRKTWVRRS